MPCDCLFASNLWYDDYLMGVGPVSAPESHIKEYLELYQLMTTVGPLFDPHHHAGKVSCDAAETI